MSADRDVTRIVRSWLHEDGNENAERVLFAVVEQLDTTPQRPAGWLARRFPLMHSSTARIGVAAIAASVVALLGYALIFSVRCRRWPDAVRITSSQRCGGDPRVPRWRL